MSALHGGEWSDSRPGRYIPGSHWIEGWVGTTARPDVSESWKFVAHDKNRTISPRTSTPQSRYYTDWAIPETKE